MGGGRWVDGRVGGIGEWMDGQVGDGQVGEWVGGLLEELMVRRIQRLGIDSRVLPCPLRVLCLEEEPNGLT